MKKQTILITALLTVCMIFAFAGCGDSGSSDSSEDNNTAASEETKGSGCAYDFPGTGFGFDLPEGLEISKGFIESYDMGDVDYNSGVMMGWPVYYNMSQEEYDALTNDDVDKIHTAFSFQIVCVKDAEDADAAIEKLISALEDATGEKVTKEERNAYQNLKVVHQENGYIWMSSMDEKTEDLPEGYQEEYAAFYDATDEIFSNMKFYTPQNWQGGEEGADIVFETTDLDGNPVTSESLFSKNKVTMINIWATTCGPCIQEMPELEKMNQEWEKKGGAVVGLVDDVPVGNNAYLAEAQEIVEDTGVTYTNLRAWDGYQDVMSKVGTPTTYFVDSQGKLIGDPILGAQPKKYKERMEEYLSQAE